MRVRLTLFALVAVFLLMPTISHAAGIPFFGPIIPQEGTQAHCAASWAMLIVVINRLIAFLITMAIVFVMPLMIAWAGFMYVLNPISPEKRSAANTMLGHAIVGIVIALAGWLIVDAVMIALYNPNTPINGGKLGAWHELIKSGSLPLCIDLKGSLNPARPTGIATGTTAVLAATGVGACDPSTVMLNAQRAGYTNLTNQQANTLACLAQWESTCGKKIENYSWNKDSGNGKASTAYGPFQVLLSSNARCYENNVCREAAGVTGSLNCQKGFGANGFTAGGDPIILEACKRAAANLTCSTAAAVCLLQESKGSFKPWTADKSSSKQQQCINQYAI